MTPALLDLADCNLQLWHGEAHVQSPGYALLDKGRFVFGHEARRAARVRPRDVNTQFWWRLGTDPLQPPLGHARHTGDLAHAHLTTLHEAAGRPDEILFAVPGSMPRAQLSLLLGIAQQCPFQATGLVNRSVALASLHGGGKTVAHLELQLHQAAVYFIEPQDGLWSLGEQQTLPGCGLLQLQERLVETIAAAFVRQARFDPRRKAASEQALYDSLPGLLRALQDQAEATIDVAGYQARIARAELAGCADRLREGLLGVLQSRREGCPVLVEPLAATLPGLGGWADTIRIAGTDDLHRALASHAGALARSGEALALVTSLPDLGTGAAQGEQATAQASAADTVAAPTHLLLGHRARALAPGGTDLPGGWQLQWVEGALLLAGEGSPPQVNGSAYADGQRLAAGDTIGIGDNFAATLIEVT